MAAARSDVRTWTLAVVFLALLTAGITRTALLWGPTSFENTREVTLLAFAQTYQAARGIYAPPRAARRVAVLGNSRVYVAARPALVEAALGAATRDLAVENLGIFGAGAGDQEVLSRHLHYLDPALVVLTLDPTDLLDTRALPLEGVPARLLDIGFADGPIPPADAGVRVARWGRTLWRLFRFREFTRAVLADRVAPDPSAAPFPDRFAGVDAVFRYMDGPRAPAVEAAYRAWRAAPTLPGFVRYLEVASPSHLQLVRARTREARDLTPDSLGMRVLDVLLGRLRRLPGRAMVVLMPENPLLRADVAGEYHRPGLSDEVVALVAASARAHGIALVDLRASLPAEAFLDFDHPMPDLSGFQRLLAAEIARALAA